MKNRHFRLAINNLWKRKNNSYISLAGLAIAFTAIFHVYSIVDFERGYDAQHEKAERIYRISGDIIANENTMTHAVLGPLMGPGLKEEFPAVESFVRLVPQHQTVKLESEKGIFEIEESYTTDSSVFSIFSFHFLYGDPSQALQNPNEVVINKSLSQKMFGNTNPVGQTIIRDGTPITVAGVINDSPENCHHKLNVLYSLGDPWKDLSGIPEINISEGYWMPTCYVFILLKENAKIGRAHV